MGGGYANKMWKRFNSLYNIYFCYLLCQYLLITLVCYMCLYIFLHAGIRFSSYHGNFMLRSTDLLALPAVDCDKAYAMQLSLEETLLTTQTVYFQVALLYP